MRKGYLLHPTKDEFFKTKHPFATFPMLLLLAVYYIICKIFGWNSVWMVLGGIGSLLLGVGLTYFSAILLKVYKKYHVPLLLTALGGILVAVSIVAML